MVIIIEVEAQNNDKIHTIEIEGQAHTCMNQGTGDGDLHSHAIQVHNHPCVLCGQQFL